MVLFHKLINSVGKFPGNHWQEWKSSGHVASYTVLRRLQYEKQWEALFVLQVTIAAVEDWIRGWRSCTRESASANLRIRNWWPCTNLKKKWGFCYIYIWCGRAWQTMNLLTTALVYLFSLENCFSLVHTLVLVAMQNYLVDSWFVGNSVSYWNHYSFQYYLYKLSMEASYLSILFGNLVLMLVICHGLECVISTSSASPWR